MRKISLARTSEARSAAFRELAATLNDFGQGDIFLTRVLARSDTNARRFALELAARLKPLSRSLIPNLISLLGKSKYPSRLRISAAANIILHIPADSPLIPSILAALERKVAPVRAAERLARLMEQIPPLEAVRRRRQELLEQSLAACPRCGVRLPQGDFARHLWESHQLRYEGERVQEPWQVIEDWVNTYLQKSRGELLDRCCELAQILDPAGGVGRVHDLLARGGTPSDQHLTLRTLAAEQHASVCPHCFAIVPFTEDTEPTPVLLAGGLLLGGGFRMEVRDRFLLNWLDATVGETNLFSGPEPGHALTRRGMVCLFVLPMVLLAGVFAVLPPILGFHPVGPVCSLLFLACLSYLGIRMHWDHEEPASDRVVDHAWDLVVPRFLRMNDPEPKDQLLIAGLALASINHGDAEYREKTLSQGIQSAGENRWSDALTASLMMLKHEDREPSEDEVFLLAGRFADACTGKVAWGAMNRFFAKTSGDLKNRTRRSRLRILMLRQAFQAGLEPGDLRQLGRLAPEVGVCYASEDSAGLSRLRLLWIYRENRLWQKVGAAASVFDLAMYAQSYLEQRPDLLLLQPAPNAEESPVLICEEGIIYRESVLSGMEDRLVIRARTGIGGGYDLVVNNHRYSFKKEPTNLLNRLKAWRSFLFNEFLPRADMLQNRHSDLGDRFQNRHRRQCNACRRQFIGLPGEMGLTGARADEEEE
ncbi:hypothetical protein [Zavarzinella formosa]|uniref:hypothetical protein n=1 Tax=Zavarzinella formosa TaxID=360055 RepID=UPI001EE690FE|nr:hypothetical protein [Zavarzinella formosa]